MRFQNRINAALAGREVRNVRHHAVQTLIGFGELIRNADDLLVEVAKGHMLRVALGLQMLAVRLLSGEEQGSDEIGGWIHQFAPTS